MKKPKQIIEFKCENCGKAQPVNTEMSTENWKFYDTNTQCQCGGKYKMHYEGLMI